MKLITNSSGSTYRSCPRRYQIRYHQCYRPLATSDALRFGTMVHTGLEALWRGSGPALAEGDPWELAKATELLRGYVARWQVAPSVLAVEAEFCAPLVNPETGRASRRWMAAGKLDALVRLPWLNEHTPSRVQIVEHKTSSEDITAGSDYWKRLRLDPQISTYFVGARALGYEPIEVLYDVLGKPQLKPYKATPEDKRKYTKDGRLYANQRLHDETPEEYAGRIREAIIADPDRYYQRGTVVRLESEEREAAWDLWLLAKSIRQSELHDWWPRNPGSCVQYGRTCAYFDVCTGAASLDDPFLFERIANPHTELSIQTTSTDLPI